MSVAVYRLSRPSSLPNLPCGRGRGQVASDRAKIILIHLSSSAPVGRHSIPCPYRRCDHWHEIRKRCTLLSVRRQFHTHFISFNSFPFVSLSLLLALHPTQNLLLGLLPGGRFTLSFRSVGPDLKVSIFTQCSFLDQRSLFFEKVVEGHWCFAEDLRCVSYCTTEGRFTNCRRIEPGE